MSDAAATQAVLNLLKKIPLYRLADEPSGSSPGASAKSLEELHQAYRRFDVVMSVLTMSMVVPLGFAWFYLFREIGSLAYPETGASGRLLGPSVYFWALPAGFAGIISAALPSLLIARLVLKGRYPEYVSYYNRKHGFDSFRLLRHFAAVITALIVFAVYLGATTYTVFLEDRIVIKGPLAETRSYAYSDIRTITAVPGRFKSGARHKKPPAGRFEILFDDSYLWKTGHGLRDSLPRCDYPIMAFAARKARIQIDGPDVLTGGPSTSDCS